MKGYNEEGEAIAEALDIRYMPYEEAVDAVLESGEFAAYLTDDAAVTFTVAGRDTEQSSRILGHVERCTEGHANTYCHAGTAGEMEDAHHAGMSVGKYRAWLALREAGPGSDAGGSAGHDYAPDPGSSGGGRDTSQVRRAARTWPAWKTHKR